MGEFEKVDLVKKYNIITNNERFKKKASVWLFGREYNYLGNILSYIDDFDDDIYLYNIDDLDLQFSCKNKMGKELIIYLLDDEKNIANDKYLLVCKKSEDIEYYNLHNDRTGLYISPGVFIYDDDYDNDKSKGKERILIL